MKPAWHFAVFICIAFAGLAGTQEPPCVNQPLILDRIIPIPSAEGRFDHMAVDTKTGRVFAAVYGNDSVAVADVHRSREIHTIRGGLDEPQGVAYLPDLNRIVVTNSGDGSCKFFDGKPLNRSGLQNFQKMPISFATTLRGT